MAIPNFDMITPLRRPLWCGWVQKAVAMSSAPISADHTEGKKKKKKDIPLPFQPAGIRSPTTHVTTRYLDQSSDFCHLGRYQPHLETGFGYRNNANPGVTLTASIWDNRPQQKLAEQSLPLPIYPVLLPCCASSLSDRSFLMSPHRYCCPSSYH